MTKFEKQLQQAYDAGVNVYNFYLGETENDDKNLDGLYIDGNIALSTSLNTDAERSCVLAEEMGHHKTSYGNILDMDDVSSKKQEYKARLVGYNDQIGLMGIVKSYEHGCRSRSEAAEYLQVTEQYLVDAIKCYKSKYGIYTTIDNYIIYFEPSLTVGKLTD